MKFKIKALALITQQLALAALMTGCLFGEQQQFFAKNASVSSSTGTTTNTANGAGESSPTLHATPTPTATPLAVCNPLSQGGGTTVSAKNGLKAKMYYATTADQAAHSFTKVTDYYTNGHLANADFYFNDINVPTRSFDTGFDLGNGRLLTDDQGNVLFENFAFDIKGVIQLPAGAANRKVQFATMSDDGSNFYVTPTGSTTAQLNVGNDGTHSSMLKCGTAAVQLTSSTSVPMELQYYQGPRYHIALILLWRDWDSSAGFNPMDPSCGQSGNTYYFDPTKVPSTPKSTWLDVLTRWQVVPAEVFHVDAAGTTNPCN